jgi:hypothetical protein
VFKEFQNPFDILLARGVDRGEIDRSKPDPSVFGVLRFDRLYAPMNDRSDDPQQRDFVEELRLIPLSAAVFRRLRAHHFLAWALDW